MCKFFIKYGIKIPKYNVNIEKKSISIKNNKKIQFITINIK